jgi:RNA polymerase sigma-70 factor (ECF subfamily)
MLETLINKNSVERMWPSIEKQVTAFALSRTKSLDAAKDIAQETFIKFWKKRDSVELMDNPEAWCMTVAKNLIIDRARKRARESDIETVPTNTMRTDEKSSIETLHHRDMVAMIKMLINQLPADQKSCIVLRDIEGKSYKEIADMLDISMHAVKVNIYRGRQYLKSHLEKLNNYEQVR